MTKHCSTGAAAAHSAGTGAAPEQQLALLPDVDPETLVLIAEVDAILCAAEATLLRRPPAPPVTGCARLGPRLPGRSWLVDAQPWSAPPRTVRAVQRGPPHRNTRQPVTQHFRKAGDGITARMTGQSAEPGATKGTTSVLTRTRTGHCQARHLGPGRTAHPHIRHKVCPNSERPC